MIRPDRFGQGGHQRYLQRAVIFTCVLTGHVLLAMLLCWQFSPVLVTQAGAGGTVVTVSLVSDMSPRTPVAAVRLPAKSDPPKALVSEETVAMKAVLPSDEEGLEPASSETSVPISGAGEEPVLSDDDDRALAAFEPPSQGTPGSPCELTQGLALLLAESPAVQQGLEGLPQTDRSVANAVMLWDGQWSPESRIGGRALLRALLVKAVSSARTDCLMAVNRGPVLFLVPDRQATVVLAIGSGQWRWNDLLAGNPDADRNLRATNFYSMPPASKTPGPS